VLDKCAPAVVALLTQGSAEVLLYRAPPIPFVQLALTNDLSKSTALIETVVLVPVEAKLVCPRCIDFITCVPKTAIFLS
tara:strand:- start:1023 stop:1259 length:237 start_codon:yes stop_codon:yes gene_type:complete